WPPSRRSGRPAAGVLPAAPPRAPTSRLAESPPSARPGRARWSHRRGTPAPPPCDGCRPPTTPAPPAGSSFSPQEHPPAGRHELRGRQLGRADAAQQEQSAVESAGGQILLGGFRRDSLAAGEIDDHHVLVARLHASVAEPARAPRHVEVAAVVGGDP